MISQDQFRRSKDHYLQTCLKKICMQIMGRPCDAEGVIFLAAARKRNPQRAGVNLKFEGAVRRESDCVERITDERTSSRVLHYKHKQRLQNAGASVSLAEGRAR